MKRYNKDGFHAEHPEGKFVLFEDAERLRTALLLAIDRLEAVGMGRIDQGEALRASDDLKHFTRQGNNVTT